MMTFRRAFRNIFIGAAITAVSGTLTWMIVLRAQEQGRGAPIFFGIIALGVLWFLGGLIELGLAVYDRRHLRKS